MNQAAGLPLSALRDIHLPAAVSWWPPAPGWWLLAALLCAASLAGWRLYRRRPPRLQQAALRELAQGLDCFHRDRDRQALAARLSRLLRRYAMVCFPKREVAGLSGERWLQFLDRTGGGGRFTQGSGRALLSAPYRPGVELDGDALGSTVEAWIRANGQAQKEGHV